MTTYKQFKDYQVTLHDEHKRSKIMRVRKCASPSAAVRVAELLSRMSVHDVTRYRGTMAYAIDEKGKPIYN